MIYKTKPFQHQEKAYYKFMLERGQSINYTLKGREYTADGLDFFGLFMEVGTGKTKVSIDIASNLYNRGEIHAVLLVAPNGIQRQWINEEIPKHSPLDFEGLLWKNTKAKYFREQLENFTSVKKSKIKYFCVNIDRFSTSNKQVIECFSKFLNLNKTLLIIDEATTIKNPDAQRTKNLSFLGLLARFKIILTGTPITNSVFDIYSMMDFLRSNFWKCNHFIFQNRYGIFVKDKVKRFGKNNQCIEQTYNREILARDYTYIRKLLKEGKSTDEIALMSRTSEANINFIKNNPDHKSSYKNIEEIRDVMRKFCYIVKAADCLELPPKSYQTIPVDMSADQEKIYKNLKKNYMAELDGEELTIQNKLLLSLRLQQIVGGHFPYKNDMDEAMIKQIPGKNPKVEVLKGQIAEQGENICIIWARFRPEIKLIYNELSKTFPNLVIEKYFGDTSQDRREDIKTRFQSGHVDILIMNPQTGAMGLNLQNCHINYIYSNTYSIQDRIQLEGRTHRSGQKEHVIYKDIICHGTVDTMISKALKQRKDLGEYFKENEDLEF
jgi:SNF2 family DNA or RNA helicase